MSRPTLVVPLIVGAAQFMHQFDGAVIATALPSMAASLHEDPVRLNLAITTYLLALAVFVPVSGWMADKFGAKRVFISAIVVFTVSSVLCGIAHSLLELVLYRTLQGMGGAMMTPVGRVIVLKSVPKLQLVQAMNAITIPAVLGPLLGPSVGGFIVTYFSWPWIFFINLPIGLAGILLVRLFIPDVHAEQVARFDLRGFVLIGMAVAGLVFGFEAIGRGVVPVSIILAALAAGAMCAGFYLIHARRTSDPIIDLSLLRILGVHLGRRPVLSGNDVVGLSLGSPAAAGLRTFRLPGRAHDASQRRRVGGDAIHVSADPAAARLSTPAHRQCAFDRRIPRRLRPLQRHDTLYRHRARARWDTPKCRPSFSAAQRASRRWRNNSRKALGSGWWRWSCT
jgi:MFS family permease